MPLNPYRLYLVTDEQQDLQTQLKVVEQAVQGGVTMVQVREKHHDIRAFINKAAAIKQVLEGSNVPLIINDRVDVALAINADGVHLGQSDMPVELARQLLGPNKLLGLSIENEQQLKHANNLPIDYIGLSAIFATATKSNIKKQWGLVGLENALNQTTLPIVAIGGINKTNISAIAQTGVHGIALVSAISHASSPQQAARELTRLLAHPPQL
ncbi:MULTISPECIES: thiamine phosphate synthase [Vibrio]|uniref:Thiamine-phosphate synthase n=1 Tax=Vibrio qingdaonensis TaxID=2829491 RepID=A0A9X3CQ06_9VIBR|nr:thiamine phosphate synthase [Vibrio qingdaonensis]MCW8347473.1 thiamine phosphate synthase [Vibrio qingdaonensis]